MVISIGLPLLMVKGQFHSLNSMTVENLETFIPFLVKCSIHRAGAQLINGIPKWWSSIIKFQFPLQKPMGLSKIGYLKHLCMLVYSCYWYHKAEYLLSFSAKIAANPKAVLFRSNNDNTTSVFSLHMDHVVKFSNENKNYDAQEKSLEKISPSKRLFLSPKKSITSIPDIYLCDNCDAEFFSHAEMLKHEKVCYEVIIGEEENNDKNLYISSNNRKKKYDIKKINNECTKNNKEKLYNDNAYCDVNCTEDSNSNSSEEIEIIKHIKHTDSLPIKDKLFNYLGLEQTSNKNLAKLKRYAFTSPFKYHIKTYGRYLLKNENIEFSSDLGKKVFKNFDKDCTNNRIIRNTFWYENYCGTKTFSSKCLKPLPDIKISRRKRRQITWYHEYSFGRTQRMKKFNRLKTGLNERSQRLLKQCKPLKIVLTRL